MRDSVNLDAVLRLASDLDGEEAPSPALAVDYDATVRVVGFCVEEGDIQALQDGVMEPLADPVVVLQVEVTWPDGKSQSESMILGIIAIEESIVFMVEEQVRKGVNGAVSELVPEFPYHVVERVYEYIVGGAAKSAYFPAALGTLSPSFRRIRGRR